MSQPIPGDPQGMRAKAAEFRNLADDVRQRAGDATGQADRLRFRGPAADRFRQRLIEWRTLSTQISGNLEQVAAMLVNEAAACEAAQIAEARRVAAAAAAAAKAAKR